jgi:hypothetical protein
MSVINLKELIESGNIGKIESALNSIKEDDLHKLRNNILSYIKTLYENDKKYKQAFDYILLFFIRKSLPTPTQSPTQTTSQTTNQKVEDDHLYEENKNESVSGKRKTKVHI